MDKNTISGKIDAPKLVREMSREAFVNMPKAKLIGDKRRKAPRHRVDYRIED